MGGTVPSLSRTAVFIHGAWVTDLCWEKFSLFFKERGYRTLAPPWPHKDRSVEEIRRDPSALAGLGVAEIVDHYERIVRAELKPPLLVGHSFGGLFVQMLLDRGLGAAGVAIHPAPPRWVPVTQWTSIRANLGVLTTWGGWRKVVRMSFPQFQYAFVNGLAEAEQRAAYDRYVVPETGRIFFQSGLQSPATGVNFKNSKRAPLLITAGGEDHIVPVSLNRSNFRRYAGSGAVTDFQEFPGLRHWVIAEPGWEEVAEHVTAWFERQA
ncbi:MAG TPA: alpha/beta hydrolase [Candidatus Acidoferrales bacterium]|nr:alpha/beta hydrolase [Candidatus Acidoferrales bacterium]